MNARWMIPILTAFVAVVAQAQEAPEPGFTVSAVWTVHWGNRRSVVIGPGGHLVDTVSHPLLMMEERGDLTAERDLSPSELSALEALVRESGIMDFPEDLSSPPYYVDEAIAVLEIHLDGKFRQHHRVRDRSGGRRPSTMLRLDLAICDGVVGRASRPARGRTGRRAPRAPSMSGPQGAEGRVDPIEDPPVAAGASVGLAGRTSEAPKAPPSPGGRRGSASR